MPSRTPTQDKALAWWCDKNNLMLQMSTHPKYYFKNRETGEVTTRMLEQLTNEYKSYIKDERKTKKRGAE